MVHSNIGGQLCAIVSVLNRSYRIGLVTQNLPMEEEVAVGRVSDAAHLSHMAVFVLTPPTDTQTVSAWLELSVLSYLKKTEITRIKHAALFFNLKGNGL